MKIILFLFIILLTYYSVIADETIVKFYMNDGSQPKEFKISEIENLDFIHSNLSYQMIIFHKDNGLKTEFDIRDIDSIRFENNTKMIIAMNTEIIEQNISDIDSILFVWNTCDEIQIGNQIWMCKNLDVDHYRNGDPIPQVTDSTAWVNLTTGAWCYYNNDSTYGRIYGKLYNGYAVNDPRGLAPEGWHVPSNDEWTTLSDYLGGELVAGGKLKEAGRTHWAYPNDGATNESGFSALPGGLRRDNGPYILNGNYGYWWSSTESNAYYTWVRTLFWSNTYINRGNFVNVEGLSVRCVKD